MKNLKHEKFAERLIKAMADAGYCKMGHANTIKIDVKGLSSEANVSYEAARQWIDGASKPREDKLKKIANWLQVSAQWLRDGSGPIKPIQHIAATNDLIKYVPLISWQQATIWTADYFKYENSSFELLPIINENISEKAFALTLTADSIQSLQAIDNFIIGSQIIIDPDSEPRSSDYIIGFFKGTTEATFKQLLIDKGLKKSYLKSHNPIFPLTEINDSFVIVGSVVSMIKKFK
jgi:SOS-response transcriptional repressor LexA